MKHARYINSASYRKAGTAQAVKVFWAVVVVLGLALLALGGYLNLADQPTVNDNPVQTYEVR